MPAMPHKTLGIDWDIWGLHGTTIVYLSFRTLLLRSRYTTKCMGEYWSNYIIQGRLMGGQALAGVPRYLH